MAISKDEINKYIFDPENPKQCKSYGALLNIAKKEGTKTFISPDYFKYFISNQILTSEFDSHIWDKPINYYQLNIFEKLELYIKQNSLGDLQDFYKDIVINFKTIQNKYKIFKSLVDINRVPSSGYYDITTLNSYKNDMLINSDKNININLNNLNQSSKNFNYIFFSKSIVNILKFKVNKLAVMIMDENQIDNFLKYPKSKIKPIFLKKIEDVDILLNVLEKDLILNKRKEPKKEIQTINNIEIKNFFSINNIKIDNLKDKKEIYIVGENGDGKTLFLQAITIALKGDIADGLEEFRRIKDYKLNINKNNIKFCKDNFFAYGASRNNSCNQKNDKSNYLTLFNSNYNLVNPIEWLKELDYREKSGKRRIISVVDAQQLLKKLLHNNIDIDINVNQVTFKERGSEVSFEQLSAGYKSVIILICDLINRLSIVQSFVDNINEFKGIVLIDEIELHLHPKWKYNFMKKLRDTFPLIQFIVTTHSPTVLLGASKEAVFYKIYKEDGEVKISNQIVNEGYTHNSLVSSPLFDLENITSRNYKKDVSSSDYVYSKIHEVISKRLKDDIDIDEDELLKLIDKELDRL